MSLKAILFDVDGTLADTESLGHRPAYNRAFRKLGLQFRWGPKLYRKLLRLPGGRERLRHYLQRYRPELGTHGSAVEQDMDAWVADVHSLKSKYFRSYMRRGRVPLRPGIARLMREAHADGIRLAIVTNASRKTLEPVLRFSMGPELASIIEVIASGEEVRHKKPSPDVYQLALGRLGVAANECVALEDSEMGLNAAKAAGIPAVVTVNDDTREQNFEDAALVVTSLGEPGAPARALVGQLSPVPWVTLPTLKALVSA